MNQDKSDIVGKMQSKDELIIYNDNFVPQPGWQIYKTNSKIKSFNWKDVGECWQKCRTKEVCSLYDAGNEDQVPFNLSVLIQLLRKDLIPEDWKTYLAYSLPANKPTKYDILKRPILNHPQTIDKDDIYAYQEIPIPRINTRAHEDSWESIAFVGTVYLNHNGNECVPALYMKPNRQLDIRYICPQEMFSNNSSALAHVHGFRDSVNNLPSTIAYGLINL